MLSVTQEASRRQEYAADRVAADIAGHANAAAALHEMPSIAAAYSFYLERYVARGIERDLLPPPPEVLRTVTRGKPGRGAHPRSVCTFSPGDEARRG